MIGCEEGVLESGATSDYQSW